MTKIWMPEIQSDDSPLYLSITKALAEDISSGKLQRDMRLPTHRELAYQMNVALGTITRAYIEAEKRGLIRSEGRRGTFVGKAKQDRSLLAQLTNVGSRMINFSHNHPSYADDPDILPVLKELAQSAASQRLLEYPPSPGFPDHREAGARWLAELGYHADPDSIIITGGSQHAFNIIIGGVTNREDILLTDIYTYPGMKAVAELYGIHLLGVNFDKEGMMPDAIETLCNQKSVRALYLNPTLHNPTSIIYSEQRRKEIAELAIKYDFLIFEDEILRPLVDNPPPFASDFAPDRSFVMMSASKTIAAGLRVGYLTAPPKYRQLVIDSLQTSILSIAPLCAEILTRWINDGTAAKVIARRKKEMISRQKAAIKIMGRYDILTNTNSQHIWLNLPDIWTGSQFAFEAYRRGVALTPSEIFAVRRDLPSNAVRISLASVANIEIMKQGLQIIASILEGTPLQDSATV